MGDRTFVQFRLNHFIVLSSAISKQDVYVEGYGLQGFAIDHGGSRFHGVRPFTLDNHGGGDEPVVVTSAYHLPCQVIIFRSVDGPLRRLFQSL